MANAIYVHPCDLRRRISLLEPVELGRREDLAVHLRSPQIESRSTAGDLGRVAFWFDSQLRPVPHDVNWSATELLLAAGDFHARSVPLLRGRIVLTSFDSNGGLAGLTGQQIRQMVLHPDRCGGRWILHWRYALDAGAQRRRRKAHRMAQLGAFGDTLPDSQR